MKLVIFDCDGTLVDSQHMICSAMTQAFETNGLTPLERPEVLAIVGLSLPLAVRRLLPAESEELVTKVTASYKDAFGELRRDPKHQEPLYPGIAKVVDLLGERTDCLLGVATGKSRRGVTSLMQRFSWNDRFATIQTADTHPSKPHPSMIETAMRESGAVPDETVMIGDTSYDMEMARNAGVAAIGVSWGYHNTSALKEAGADQIIHQQLEIPDVVDRLFGSERL